MKKIFNIIISIVAACAVLVSCDVTSLGEETVELLGSSISVNLSQLDEFAGVNPTPVNVTVTCDGDWVAQAPSWITVTPNYGTGNAVVSICPKPNLETNEAGGSELAGSRNGVVTFAVTSKSATVAVPQEGDPSKPSDTIADISCAGFNALPDGPSMYRITGKVTKIANSTYGNMYVKDDTGEVYVYGTLNWDGETQKFSSLGLAVGDIITLYGCKSSYGTTMEMVNGQPEKIVKSLIAADKTSVSVPKEAGTFTLKLCVSGDEGFLAEAQDNWVRMVGTVSGIRDTTIVTFQYDANTSAARSTSIVLSSSSSSGLSSECTVAVDQEGSISDISCADFNALEDGPALYRISGIVTKIAKETDNYGTNLYVKDATGEVYVYGTTDEAGKALKLSSLGVKVGDILTVYGKKTTYGTTIELANGVYVEHTSVKTATVAEILAASDSKTDYYYVTGTVTNCTERISGTKFDLTTYGNYGLKDASGEIYVYGTSTGWNGVAKQFGTLEVKEGDTITLVGYKTSYKGLNEFVAMYVSHETPAPSSPYEISLAYTLGSSYSWDDSKATVNGESVAKVIKLGSSSKTGEFTVTVPKGSSKLTFYAVSWYNTDAVLTYKIDGVAAGTQNISKNAGATGNSPFTFTVADSDKYSLAVNASAADVNVNISANKRAIFFGIKAE